MMAESKMIRREQHCISECIIKHWGPSGKDASEDRDQKYEQCLSDCNICS